MTKQRFCPHCGERIADDEEQRFCMFCGETLKDEGLSDSKIIYDSPNGTTYEDTENHASFSVSCTYEPIYKPSGWQTLAAIIIPLAALTRFMSSFAFPGMISDMMMDSNIEEIRAFKFIALINPVLLLCAYGLLYKRANNMATRTAMKLLLAILFFFVLYILLQIGMGMKVVEYKKAFGIIGVLITLTYTWISIYAYALIVRNNRLCKSNRTWINLLGIFQIQGFLAATGMLGAIGGEIEFAVLSQAGNVSFFFFDLYAMWKMARCEAFAAQYDAEARADYSLQNRQMLVATIFFILFFILPILILLFH